MFEKISDEVLFHQNIPRFTTRELTRAALLWVFRLQRAPVVYQASGTFHPSSQVLLLMSVTPEQA